MPITPESKDWTWILERRCDQCSFDASSTPYDAIPGLLLDNAAQWPGILARPDVRVRPNDSTWSPLEYAAHVRDVHRIMKARLDLITMQDDPTFAFWDQDATAEEERYQEQDPDVVADELATAAQIAADAFGSVPADDRERTGRRAGDGAIFTVTSLARYFAHDPIHHVHDVRG